MFSVCFRKHGCTSLPALRRHKWNTESSDAWTLTLWTAAGHSSGGLRALASRVSWEALS